MDLCWGVAKEIPTTDVGAGFSLSPGYPFIDLPKPSVGDKIHFDFKHALSQLNVQIQADADAVLTAAETKIYVRSITFEGFTTKGALNLNSTTSSSGSTILPNWFDVSGNSRLSTTPVTIYDGRRDGKEGYAGAETNNEMPKGLNPVLIQTDTDTDGVTAAPVNLFNSATETAPIFVIPTGEPMNVTIVYDVETKDDKLATFLSDGVTHGSSIENKISKTVTFDGGVMEAGKKYTLNLQLGLRSVNFSAEVGDWEDVDVDDADTNLPANLAALGAITFGGVDNYFVKNWVTDTPPAVDPDEFLTVKDDQDHVVSSGLTVTYASSNPSVVTVHPTSGALAFEGPGEANITATVIYQGKQKTASYPVYLYALSGITLEPQLSDKIKPDAGTIRVKAKLAATPAASSNPDRTLPNLSSDFNITLAQTGGTFTVPTTIAINAINYLNAFKDGEIFTVTAPTSASVSTITATVPAGHQIALIRVRGVSF